MPKKKTNAARILDSLDLSYELLQYEVDESDLSASHLAKISGLDPKIIYKTIILEGNKTGYFVCLLAAHHELDLKKAAQVSGNKNCQLIPIKDLQRVTGYIRGGCSALAMKKEFPTYIDVSIKAHDMVIVNAGQRGLQFMLAPADIIAASKGHLEDLVKDLPFV